MKKNSRKNYFGKTARGRGEDDFYYLCFTKLPPKDVKVDLAELNKYPAYISEAELKPMALIDIRLAIEEFQETQNPIYLMSTFVSALDAGVYPPLFTLEYISEAFRKYAKAFGKRSLDHFLGLKTRRGENSLIKARALELRDGELCFDIFRLKTWFKFSDEKAVELVWNKFSNSDWNKTVLKLKTIGQDRMLKIYQKRKNGFRGMEDILNRVPPQRRKEILETFSPK